MRVLSIPAGGTIDLIKRYSIHAFPHPRSYDYSGLVTFRRSGGFMDCLYSVQQKIIIDFKDDNWEAGINFTDEAISARIKGYIENRVWGFGFERPIFMFWVLNVEDDLKHEPRPIHNYNNHVYFEYDEILSGKEIVTIESKSR